MFRDKGLSSMLCVAIMLGALLSSSMASACTGVQLTGADKTVVRGRTMEWGLFDLESDFAVFPRGMAFTSKTPDGGEGAVWTGRYGFAGIRLLGLAVYDGMNEKGLSAGVFYHNGFADYGAYDPADAARSLAPDDMVGYVLSSFATLEEVREGFTEVTVTPVPNPALDKPAGLHMLLTEPGGASMVVEFLHGGVQFHDNPVGVITNNPGFDWQLTNLRNYGFLSAAPFKATTWGSYQVAPLAAGSGMLGLPGDFTSPSRFVRAVVFAHTARATKGGEDTVQELFRILDNFDEGVGQGEGSESGKAVDFPSATQWTIAEDTANLRIYYHTMFNRRVRMVDLKELDFSCSRVRSMPLDAERRQDVLDKTGVLD